MHTYTHTHTHITQYAMMEYGNAVHNIWEKERESEKERERDFPIIFGWSFYCLLETK